MSKDKAKSVATENSGNLVYCLGLFGAAIYYVQQAEGFWEVIVALFKALFWPGFLVYELLKYIAA